VADFNTYTLKVIKRSYRAVGGPAQQFVGQHKLDNTSCTACTLRRTPNVGRNVLCIVVFQRSVPKVSEHTDPVT
jgi:hypothetical protein